MTRPIRRTLVTFVLGLCLVIPLTAAAAEEPRVNEPPQANPDAATVDAGKTVVVPVLANDTDDGYPSDLTVTGTSSDPRVSFDPDSVTFAAAATDSGPQSFTYDISDGELTATSTVTVTVTPQRRSVTLSAPRRAVALHTFRLSGRVGPQRRTVVALEQRRGGGAWRVVARTRSAADGRFAFTRTPSRLVRLRFRAVADGVRSPVVDRTVTATADVVVSGPLTAGDVRWSYRSGCPVGPSRLRRITVTYVSYDWRVRRGRVVVAASAVPAVASALTRALAGRFRFRQLVPADHFYAGGRRTPTQSDLAAMRADNTSAFNCRSVTGNPYRLSQHSYGNAIDINTVRNPYVTASRVYPSFARTYLDRSNRRPGMLFRDGVVASVFRARGWLWGARWRHPDYQHFSSNGG